MPYPELQEPVRPEISQHKPLLYLGKNLKQVTVLVNYPREAHLPQEQLAFLTNIFKACGLTTDDIAIVNTATQPAPMQEVIRQLQPSCLLLFGTMLPAPLPAEGHFTITAMDGIPFMAAPELEQLNRNDPESRLLKSKLWLALKRLFNV